MSKKSAYAGAAGLALLLPIALLLSAASDSDRAAVTNTAVAAALRVARSGACAANLKDGSVLITGGHGSNGVLATTEVFSAKSGSKDASPMSNARESHACVALPDGRVLVAGGATTGGGATNSAEVFNPATGKWTPAAAMLTARSGAAAVKLADGRALIAGGDSNGVATSSLEIFDSATNSFRAVVGGLSSPRVGHAAVVLQNGLALIAGGSSNGKDALDSIDVYDPVKGTLSPFGKKLS